MFNSIFDEVKEVRYFTRNNRFQESFNAKYFKEIKRLKSPQVKAVSYLESKRAYMAQFFVWIYLTAYYFRNKSYIIDVQLGYIQAFENIEIFKLKLRWSKSSRLLKCVAFLVSFEITYVIYKMCGFHWPRNFLFFFIGQNKYS